MLDKEFDILALTTAKKYRTLPDTLTDSTIGIAITIPTKCNTVRHIT